tara:strand:- start:2623 stop:2781 length:159 start_codon:yes stop_codon:yes gene_type:complete
LEEAIDEFGNMHEAFDQALDWVAELVADDPKEYHLENDRRWREIKTRYDKFL